MLVMAQCGKLQPEQERRVFLPHEQGNSTSILTGYRASWEQPGVGSQSPCQERRVFTHKAARPAVLKAE